MQSMFKNNTSYKFISKISVIFILSILFSNIVYYTQNIHLIITLFYLLTIVCIVSVNFEITHPYTWFLPFFVLYSTSFSILYLTNGFEEITYNKSFIIESLKLSWVAFITFIIVILPKRYSIKVNFKKNDVLKANFTVKFIYILSILGIVLMCLYIIGSGASNKKEIKLQDSYFVTLGLYSIQFFVFSFLVILMHKLQFKGKIDRRFVVLSLLTSLVVVFIAGERDFLLRIVIITFIVVNIFIKKFSGVKLICYGIIGLFLVNVLQNLKNIFITDEIVSNQGNSILKNLLGGEFISAGRNLYTLVQNSMNGLFSSNNTLILDLKFAVTNLPFVNVESIMIPTAWYNNTFYEDYTDQGGGKGFTIIGEGYINFGMAGIIFWFIILAIIIKFVYKLSSRNVPFFLAYILLIPHTIYILRADFGIYFSSLIKYILIPILLIYLIALFKKGKEKSTT